MSSWLKRKSRVEKLEQKYVELMRKSFKVALRDKNESEKVQKQAYKVFDEIRYLTLQNADK
ncbi:Lacal_2735 family protein [Rasiella sp. SM2506]|uniref:Lacal_2735 family protein n=1 Tax=Rasiella sp. SM2506 TaxID=3423914 RepID=UPI003D7BD715